MHVLVIDSYDSFTWNLVDVLTRIGATVEVAMNDAISGAEAKASRAGAIVLSPGPCTPTESGACLDVARLAVRGELDKPLLGVCLGHQAIGAALGARIVRARVPVHGETSAIFHDGSLPHADLPQGYAAARYNSLVLERSSLPPELAVTAWTEEGEVMGLRHTSFPIIGVQFHPESFMTHHGEALLEVWHAEASS